MHLFLVGYSWAPGPPPVHRDRILPGEGWREATFALAFTAQACFFSSHGGITVS